MHTHTYTYIQTRNIHKHTSTHILYAYINIGKWSKSRLMFLCGPLGLFRTKSYFQNICNNKLNCIMPCIRTIHLKSLSTAVHALSQLQLDLVRCCIIMYMLVYSSKAVNKVTCTHTHTHTHTYTHIHTHRHTHTDTHTHTHTYTHTNRNT